MQWTNSIESARLVELHSTSGFFPFEIDNGDDEHCSSRQFVNSVGVGATPPSWIEEMGIECMVHCILLGPLVRRTLSSYDIVATL